MTPKAQGKDLKSKAKASGGFVEVNIPNIYHLVQSLGYFFYQKHHEWIAVCFVTEQFHCPMIWFNKGPSRYEVTLELNPEHIVTRARRLNARYIVISHNHPVSSKDLPDLGSRRANIRVHDELKRELFGPSEQDKLFSVAQRLSMQEANLGFAEILWVSGEYYIDGDDALIRNFDVHKEKALGRRPKHKTLNKTENSSECFVVTFCFGRDSQEYATMIKFRDQIMMKSTVGRLFVRLYYLISPKVTAFASRKPMVARVLRRMVGRLVTPVSFLLRSW